MSGKTHKIKPIVFVRAAIITLLAFGLSHVLMQPFTLSLATLASSNDRYDFNITDFYNVVADGRAVRTLNEDITILDISGATREDVAYVLDALPEIGPRAVGLDVMFDVPHDDDSLLLAAISKLPDMVMLVDVEGETERDAKEFHISKKSFFHDSINHRSYGASNLPTQYAGGVVREFAVGFPLKKKDNKSVHPDMVYSLPVALAEKADSNAVVALRERGSELEAINFPSTTFNIVKWYDMSDKAESLRDQVVLIGAIDAPEDMHATPVSRKMAGVEIHAHALRTILDHDYLNPVSEWVNIGIACLLCYILAFIYSSLPKEFKPLSLRFIQVLTLYLIIRIGYYYFIDRNILVNFSYALLMLAFVLFACDICFGVLGIYDRIKKYSSKKIERQRNYENTNTEIIS